LWHDEEFAVPDRLLVFGGYGFVGGVIAQSAVQRDRTVAEAAYEKYVTLPIHPRLTDDAISYMADCIAEISNSE
jgi:dTDP-4-amino-4,6-dideoxygalactose transaminase